jgi:methionine-S-sulfoxide reductase
VIRTRVGYTGGTTLHPTYRDIGDHTEAVEVEFDPRVVSYQRLLDVFWKAHDPYVSGGSRQYRSAVWTHGPEQARLARASAEALARRNGRPPATAILPSTTFTVAEDYHQKYYLRGRGGLLATLLGKDADDATIRDSTLAARVNGWLAGYAEPGQVASDPVFEALDTGQRRALGRALGERAPVACR